MTGHAEQCVERYLELADKDINSLKTVATPCIDDRMFAPEDFVSKGETASVAARIVLKALYLARTIGPCGWAPVRVDPACAMIVRFFL